MAKTRSVGCNQAVDGVQITNCNIVTLPGFKMIDVAAKHPKTKQLLYGSTNPTFLQSRDNCFPIMMIFDKESKETMEHLVLVMKNVKQLTIDPIDEYKPIKCAMNCDLACNQRIT
jgi:hypothetical protein